MADVDICNRALAAIGARATIASLNDPTQAAVQCKLQYNTIRKMLLRAAHWGFARRQVALAQLGSQTAGTAPFPWLYSYAYPSDCLKMRYMTAAPVTQTGSISVPVTGDFLLPPWQASRQYRFLIGNDTDSNNNMRKIVLTNLYQAIGVYTIDVVDTNIFDPIFEEAFVAALSSKLVIPLTGNAAMKTTFEQSAAGMVVQARVADGNEALPSTAHTPDWIAARGAYYDPVLSSLTPLGIIYAGYDSLSWGE